ncbi:CBS domain-containing protein [Gilvimarinus chinensis]|uniref:CBS domain-containing protein n=1 Tax=Gilvimarinus chinensis TaxID=396005 RepID=UPI00037DCA13|nr:CBS domain-containing protein [Gilvimarinus chinensis]
MKAKSLMSDKVVTVELDDTLATVKDIFDHVNFHHLLVVENKNLMGVISDRDLLKAISPNVDSVAATTKDLATLNKKVHQIMARHPKAVSVEASVAAVVELFNAHPISCIPVVNENNEPVGIISWRDVMRALGERMKKQGA